MEYCQLAEVHGETMDDHRAFLEVLGLENEPPDGLLGRAVGPTAGGVRIVTLWESKAAHDRFIAERLAPALVKAGRAGVKAEVIADFQVEELYRAGVPAPTA